MIALTHSFVYINPPPCPLFLNIQSHHNPQIINIFKPKTSPFSNPSNFHHLNHLPPPGIKMKSQFIIALLPLFLTTALAAPTAKPSDTDPVEVCTEATDGQPCIVVEVDGVRVAGRCIFDLVSRDWFPLIFPMERRALTGLNSSCLVGPFVLLNRV